MVATQMLINNDLDEPISGKSSSWFLNFLFRNLIQTLTIESSMQLNIPIHNTNFLKNISTVQAYFIPQA